MNEVIYKIQDLVIRKELTSFFKFKTHFQDEVKFDRELRNHTFINNLFRKIYTFLKELQKNPKSIILVQALRPLFEMLLFEMITPEFVNIFVLDYDCLVLNVDLTKAWRNLHTGSKSRLTLVKYNLFFDFGRGWLDYSGIHMWMRNQGVKRIKAVGLNNYIKERVERRRKQEEEYKIIYRKLVGVGITKEQLNSYNKFLFFENRNQKEYKDYLKTPNAVESC